MINKIIRLITDSKHDNRGVKFLAQEMGIKYSTLYSLYSGKNSNPTIETVGKYVTIITLLSPTYPTMQLLHTILTDLVLI